MPLTDDLQPDILRNAFGRFPSGEDLRVDLVVAATGMVAN